MRHSGGCSRMMPGRGLGHGWPAGCIGLGERGLAVKSWAPYGALVSGRGFTAPVPPVDLRPGQLGVVLLGRVIVGDIAATLVDLAGRGLVDVAEDPERGWLLGRSPAAAEHERGGLAGFEALLVGGLPPVRPADLAELARTYPKVMARARCELARDAVRRGWLRRVGRGQRTRQGQEL